MLRKIVSWGMIAGALTTGCAGQKPPETPKSVLPLRSIRLYETGVGYFERTGSAGPSNGTSLPVPAGHLDDALKTLVVLGQGGESQVDGLEFESSISEGMARALAGLSKEAKSAITHFDLLMSLKGDDVQVQARSGTYEGRVIEVIRPEPKEQPTDEPQDDTKERVEKQPPPELVLLLLTRDNEIRRFEADDIQAVRPTSPVTAARLGLALNTLSPSAAQTRRMLRVMAHAKGPVTLGYIAEAPLWRTTYRIVLGQDGKAVLQGWALLHNDTDEDWSQVRVQLVNGRPDSFLFPLAAPRYGRRELATPSEKLSTVPQLLDRTPDAIWGDHADDEGGEGIGLGSYGTIGHGSGTGSGSGYGYGSGSLSVSGRVSKSDLLEIGNLAGIAVAAGVESGALFTYTLPRPLDLRAHGSALVPFVQSPVEAKRITWYESDHPRMAVRFVNSTNQTLPPGPIAFFADGGFAGESALDRLKPTEQRFIEFGADIDVETWTKFVSGGEETRRLVFEKGKLAVHYVKRDKSVYTIENRSGQGRSVHWVLPVVSNARVEGPDEVTFDTARNQPIAVFEVPPRKKVEREVRTEQGLSRSYPLRNLDVATLERLAEGTNLPDEQHKTIVEAAKKRSAIQQTAERKTKNDEAIQEVEADLKRLREHLEALKGEAGGVAANPFVRRILTAEDRLTVLRQTKASLEEEERLGWKALEEVLQGLAAPEK